MDQLRLVPFRLNRLVVEVSRALERAYADRSGIGGAEWRILATLGMAEPRSARSIVRCTRTHKSKVSRAVSRPALAGLIEGAPDRDDRREIRLRMTPEGRALYERLVPVVLDHERRLLPHLSDDALCDPPSSWWTPLLSSLRGREVSDDETDLHGRV